MAQIDKMSRHLVDKGLRGASSEVPKSKAQYLLAGKGFDADRLSRDLQVGACGLCGLRWGWVAGDLPVCVFPMLDGGLPVCVLLYA